MQEAHRCVWSGLFPSRWHLDGSWPDATTPPVPLHTTDSDRWNPPGPPRAACMLCTWMESSVMWVLSTREAREPPWCRSERPCSILKASPWWRGCCRHRAGPEPPRLSGRAFGAVGVPCPKPCRAYVLVCGGTQLQPPPILTQKAQGTEPTQPFLGLAALSLTPLIENRSAAPKSSEDLGHTEALPHLTPPIGLPQCQAPADVWTGLYPPEAVLLPRLGQPLHN